MVDEILHDWFLLSQNTQARNIAVRRPGLHEPQPSRGTGENITVGSDTWDWTPQPGKKGGGNVHDLGGFLWPTRISQEVRING